MRWHTPAALAFLLAVTAAFYWRLTISGEYTWLESPDTALMMRPWLDFQAREFHAGRFPAWDPYLWGGQSLIGQVQPGTANPLNWVLFALPLRDGHIPIPVLHWYWVSIHWLGAVFCYALCRDLGARRISSLLGACIFALTGYVGHTDWTDQLMSAIWIPLVVLFLARLFRGRQPLSSAALSGSALGAAVLGSHHNIPIYTALLAGVIWMWFLAENWRLRKAWLAASVFTATCLLVSAFQTLPAIEHGRQAVRWVNAREPMRWKDKVPYAIHAQYSLAPRSIPGMVFPGMWDGLPVNPYVGIVAVVLALAAVVQRWRSRDVQLLLVLVIGGLVLALGTHTLVYRAAYALVPLVEKARSPAMAIALAQLGIAALAALGLDRLGRIKSTAVCLLFLVEAVHAAPHFARFDRPGAYLKTMRAQEDIAVFLRRQPGWFRVQVDENAVPYNFGDWFGIEQFGGYLASMPEKVFRIVGHEEARRLFGIQYLVARQAASPQQVEVFQSRSGLKVYLDTRVAAPLESPCANRLQVILRTPNRFVIDADMRCAGLVVTGDPRLPGWRGFLDGRRVVIQESEGVLRAVAVPAGRHRIEFRYQPGSVYGGAALSVMGLLLTGLVCFLEQRSKQRDQRSLN